MAVSGKSNEWKILLFQKVLATLGYLQFSMQTANRINEEWQGVCTVSVTDNEHRRYLFLWTRPSMV